LARGFRQLPVFSQQASSQRQVLPLAWLPVWPPRFLLAQALAAGLAATGLAAGLAAGLV
jgi:hypothetical protein